MTSTQIQEHLKQHGYTHGDVLTIGPDNYKTVRPWLGIGAVAVACIGALTDSFELLMGGLVGTGMLTLAHFEDGMRPNLHLERAGIRRGERLIPWSNVRACQRVIALNRVFIELTFIDGSGREKTQRSLAAPALYRHLLEDNEAKPEAKVEAGDEATLTLGDQATYRTAPPVIAPSVAKSKEPPASWWRAFARFFAGRR